MQKFLTHVCVYVAQHQESSVAVEPFSSVLKQKLQKDFDYLWIELKEFFRFIKCNFIYSKHGLG